MLGLQYFLTAVCFQGDPVGFTAHAMAVLAMLLSVAFYTWVMGFLVYYSTVDGFPVSQVAVVGVFGVLFGMHMAVEVGILTRKHLQRAKGNTDTLNAVKTETPADAETAALLPKPVNTMVFYMTEEHLKGLRATTELAAILAYVYLCDRTSIFAKGKKIPSTLYYVGVNGVILLAAFASVRKSKGRVAGTFLNRDQTEEWKGWMQTQFLLYHYFMTESMYNPIRLYIACYVWMTGYGNTIYYYKTGDFGLIRFCAMMWRLNFFTIFLCIILQNEFMLYYIVPMHTLFTWLVYFTLRINSNFNNNDKALTIKLLITTIITIVMWNNTYVFHAVWGPLEPLLGFHDPLHPEFKDSLHEWEFRSGLDHLIWLVGMVCGLWMAHPKCNKAFVAWVDKLPREQWMAWKGLIAVVTALVFAVYMYLFGSLPKKEYNKVHPYTSAVPIFAYILLRNCSHRLRCHYLHMFTFMGRVTLETYVLQFHIWMKTTGLNGSPKALLVWIPDDFLGLGPVNHFLNLALVSAAYFFISYRTFKVTVVLKDFCIPEKDPELLKTRACWLVGLCVLAYLMAVLFTYQKLPTVTDMEDYAASLILIGSS